MISYVGWMTVLAEHGHGYSWLVAARTVTWESRQVQEIKVFIAGITVFTAGLMTGITKRDFANLAW